MLHYIRFEFLMILLIEVIIKVILYIYNRLLTEKY
jgi:hypothetical protein